MSEADKKDTETARQRDELVRRMIATPPKTQKGDLKRPPEKPPQKPGKRGS